MKLVQIKPRTIESLGDAVLEQRELEKLAPSTGFDDLDACIGGFLPRHLYTLSGQTHSGKTMVACNFADAVRKQDKKILYIALEPDVNVVITLAAVRTNKRPQDLTEEDLRFDDGMIKILLQEDVKTLKELLEIIVNAGEEYSLIIIDHISYFVTGDNTNQEQSNAMKVLAKTAKHFKTAVLVIAHVRKNIKGFISMDDISGSGAFKQDSTDVILLHRFKKEEEAEELNPTYRLDALLTVPKSKYFSKRSSCGIYFQPDKLKILGENQIYHG